MDQKPAAPAAFYHNSLQPSSGARHQPTHTFHSTPLLPFPCTQGTPGRVVVLSSSAHGFGRIHIEDLNCERRWYGAWATYGNAKLVRGRADCARQGSLVPLCKAGYSSSESVDACTSGLPTGTQHFTGGPMQQHKACYPNCHRPPQANLLFVKEMARRLKEEGSAVEAFALHPGGPCSLVLRTLICSSNTGMQGVPARPLNVANHPSLPQASATPASASTWAAGQICSTACTVSRGGKAELVSAVGLPVLCCPPREWDGWAIVPHTHHLLLPYYNLCTAHQSSRPLHFPQSHG